MITCESGTEPEIELYPSAYSVNLAVIKIDRVLRRLDDMSARLLASISMGRHTVAAPSYALSVLLNLARFTWIL